MSLVLDMCVLILITVSIPLVALVIGAIIPMKETKE